MNLRAMYALIAPLLLVAALLPAPAVADNSVTNSTGTVQAGGIGAAPTAAGELVNGAVQTAATAPVAVGAGGGDNSASHSIGAVQVGGDNSADDSLVTVQASDVRTRPGAVARAAGLRVRVASPVSTGSGRNQARRSAVTVQLGGGSSERSLGRIETGRPVAEPSAALTRTPRAASSAVPRLVGRTASVRLPDRGLARSDSGVSGDVDVDLRSAHARVHRAEVDPSLGVALHPLAGIVLGGRIAVDPPAGSAERSFGTVQAGGVTVAPTLALWTPLGTLGLDGQTLGIAGGGNRASESIGTAQVGGGNEASDSLGSVQVSGISVGPRLTLSDSPVGNAAIGSPLAIGGPGGNRAEGSIGTVQIGGGNTARGSMATLQVGSSSGSNPPSCCAPTDWEPSAGGTTPAGGSPGGTPSAASTNTGTSALPGVSRSTVDSRPAAGPGVPGGPASEGSTPDGDGPNAGGVLPASDSRRSTGGGHSAGELPFTGQPLWLIGFAALFLIAGGMAVRGGSR